MESSKKWVSLVLEAHTSGWEESHQYSELEPLFGAPAIMVFGNGISRTKIELEVHWIKAFYKVFKLSRDNSSLFNFNFTILRAFHLSLGMFFILSKILGFLFMPMSWIVIALVASFFIKKYSKKLRLAALIILLFFGNSFILNEVKLLWEVPVTLDQNLDHHNTELF